MSLNKIQGDVAFNKSKDVTIQASLQTNLNQPKNPDTHLEDQSKSFNALSWIGPLEVIWTFCSSKQSQS